MAQKIRETRGLGIPACTSVASCQSQPCCGRVHVVAGSWWLKTCVDQLRVHSSGAQPPVRSGAHLHKCFFQWPCYVLKRRSEKTPSHFW